MYIKMIDYISKFVQLLKIYRGSVLVKSWSYNYPLNSMFLCLGQPNLRTCFFIHIVNFIFVVLSQPSINYFKITTSVCLKCIQKIRLARNNMGNDPSWHVVSVGVRRVSPYSRYQTFLCNAWLASLPQTQLFTPLGELFRFVSLGGC